MDKRVKFESKYCNGNRYRLSEFTEKQITLVDKSKPKYTEVVIRIPQLILDIMRIEYRQGKRDLREELNKILKGR